MADLPTEQVLTFNSWQKAQDVADKLFKKGLAQQIEFLPVKGPNGENQIKLIVKSEVG